MMMIFNDIFVSSGKNARLELLIIWNMIEFQRELCMMMLRLVRHVYDDVVVLSCQSRGVEVLCS